MTKIRCFSDVQEGRSDILLKGFIVRYPLGKLPHFKLHPRGFQIFYILRGFMKGPLNRGGGCLY